MLTLTPDLLPTRGDRDGILSLICGSSSYFHYGVDGLDDRGWGCGYRTLQTLASWIREQKEDSPEVPSLPEIQNVLVDLGDKEKAFNGSKQWIGSFEVCLVLDQLYEVPSKLVHVRSSESVSDHFEQLEDHFISKGSPVMMGGDVDASSKGGSKWGIFGTFRSSHESSKKFLLVVDPHYFSTKKDSVSVRELVDLEYIKWVATDELIKSSFYNFCLPQLKAAEIHD